MGAAPSGDSLPPPIPLYKPFVAPTAGREMLATLHHDHSKVEELEERVGESLRAGVGENNNNNNNNNNNSYAVVAVSSGPAALHLAFHLMRDPRPARDGWPGTRHGDEVLACPL